MLREINLRGAFWRRTRLSLEISKTFGYVYLRRRRKTFLDRIRNASKTDGYGRLALVQVKSLRRNERAHKNHDQRIVSLRGSWSWAKSDY